MRYLVFIRKDEEFRLFNLNSQLKEGEMIRETLLEDEEASRERGNCQWHQRYR